LAGEHGSIGRRARVDWQASTGRLAGLTSYRIG
jgi:hypothetical protein